MMSLLHKKTRPHRKAKIISRGSCRVEMDENYVVLGIEMGTEDEPDFIVLVPPDATWEFPRNVPISHEEISEMMKFIPLELRKRDGVSSVVETHVNASRSFKGASEV